MFFKNDNERGKGGPERGIAPLLPLSDIIVFPHMVSQLFVGRERSIAALDEAMNRGKEIFLSAQRNAKTNEPTPEDIFVVGSVGVIMQLLRLPDGTVKVLVEGKRRAKIRRYVHVLNLRTTAADPLGFLVARIAGRVALRELRPMDPLERAIEIMAWILL